MSTSPDTDVSPKKTKKARCLRCLKCIVLGLLVLAIVLHFLTPSIVTKVANQKLPGLLNTTATLGGVKINLIRGSVGLQDLVIGQPEGFGETPLLSLKGIRTRVPIRKAISADPIVIATLHVDQLALCIISDTNGVLNVTQLGAAEKKAAPEPTETAEAGTLPSLLLKNLTADAFSLRYLDQRLDTDITVTHFNVALSDLQIEGTPTPQITLGALDMDDLRFEMLKGAIAAEATSALANESNTLDATDIAETEAAQPSPVEAASATNSTANPPPIPGIWIKSVRARNFGFAYKDASNDLALALKEFELTLDDIVIGTRNDAPAHGTIQMSTKLDGVKSFAYIMADGRIGPVMPDTIPVLQMTAALVGFELDTVKPITKTDATKVLGEGLDFSLMLQINPGMTISNQTLGGQWETVTSSKVAIGDTIKGTATAPELNIAKLTSQLFIGGTFRMVGNQVGNIAAGGIETTKALADTGMKAAKGISKTLSGAVLGLGKVVKGAATLDGEELLGGLHDVTVGTLTNATSTVTSTAEAAGDGIMNTAKSTAGSGKGDAWIGNLESRKSDTHKAALEWLATNPFPTQQE
jgi:hypothetical protein